MRMLHSRSLLLSLIGAALAHAPPPSIPASDPLVAWTGRYAVQSDGLSVGCDWASTAATLAISSGASGDATLTVRTNSTFLPNFAGRLNIYVNEFDAVNVLVPAGPRSFLVAAALPANRTSIVSIVYTMEVVMSGADANHFHVFSGFDLEGDGVFVPPPPLRRRVDVVGDSITAGSSYDRMEAVNSPFSLGGHCAPWCPLYGYSIMSNWQSWLGRFFQANLTTTAWSGKGLIANSGCKPGPLMPELYLTTYAAQPGVVPWDFSRSSRPDLVIVNLGTNDFSCGTTTDAAFTAALVDFFRNITALYAGSPPSPSGRTSTAFMAALAPISPVRPVAAVQAAVAQAQGEGMTAAVLDMRNATLDGCGGHPGPYGHMEMAEQAFPQIKALMGW